MCSLDTNPSVHVPLPRLSSMLYHLYALASSSSTLALAILCIHVHAIWSLLLAVLSSTTKNICPAIPNIALASSLNIIRAIVECLAQRRIIAS